MLYGGIRLFNLFQMYFKIYFLIFYACMCIYINLFPLSTPALPRKVHKTILFNRLRKRCLSVLPKRNYIAPKNKCKTSSFKSLPCIILTLKIYWNYLNITKPHTIVSILQSCFQCKSQRTSCWMKQSLLYWVESSTLWPLLSCTFTKYSRYYSNYCS